MNVLSNHINFVRGLRRNFEFRDSIESMEEFYALMIQCYGPTSQHLPTMRRLAEECDAIAELGTYNGVSAVALMMGRPERMTCVDIEPCKYIDQLLYMAGFLEIDLEFVQADSRGALFGYVDMLLVDTEHTYEHVKAELQEHKEVVGNYILFHDTVSHPEILPAIEEELPEWTLMEKYENCNGMWVMER